MEKKQPHKKKLSIRIWIYVKENKTEFISTEMILFLYTYTLAFHMQQN